MKINSYHRHVIFYIYLVLKWTPSYSFHLHADHNKVSQHYKSRPLFLTGEVINEAWTSYNNALESAPLITKSVTACCILGAADLTGQAFERRNQNVEDDTSSSIDVTRFIRFAIFGLILQAPWNHFYYLLLDGALPPTVDPLTTTTFVKVVIDQFLQAPIFTILIFYFLGILEGKSLTSIEDQLKSNYKDTMVANWKLWVPATFVNIAFVPPPLRVLYLNCIFYFWSIYLSLKLNTKMEEKDV